MKDLLRVVGLLALCALLMVLVVGGGAAACGALVGGFFGALVWAFDKVAGPVAPSSPAGVPWVWAIGGFLAGLLLSGSFTAVKIVRRR